MNSTPPSVMQARRGESIGPLHLLHVLRGRRNARIHRNGSPLGAGDLQQLGREPCACQRVAGNRGDAQQFELRAFDQRRQRVRVVDIGADVGIEYDRLPGRCRNDVPRAETEHQQQCEFAWRGSIGGGAIAGIDGRRGQAANASAMQSRYQLAFTEQTSPSLKTRSRDEATRRGLIEACVDDGFPKRSAGRERG